MTAKEFFTYTGFYPSESMFAHIEEAYYNSDLDKVAFCKAYVDNENDLAVRIAERANKKEAVSILERAEMEKTISKLQKELDAVKSEYIDLDGEFEELDLERITAEEERDNQRERAEAAEKKMAQMTEVISKLRVWEPYEVSERVSQKLYDSMAERTIFNGMETIDNTAEFIADEFGFDIEKVMVIGYVTCWERSNDGAFRKTEDCDKRGPLWIDGKLMYALFSVGKRTFEYYNGELAAFKQPVESDI